MYAGLGALSPSTQGAITASMPPCYTPQLDHCISDRSTDRSYPNCTTWRKAYDEDRDAIRKILDTLPFCPDPRSGVRRLAVVAIGSGTLGLLLGLLLRR